MREITRSKPKKRKSKVPVFLATVAALMIINIAILAILGFCSVQSEHYETTDLENYRKFSGHIEKEEEDLFSRLYIFPDEITEDAKVDQFYYYCDNSTLDNSYKIYLECTYNQNGFENEIDRLSKIQSEYNGETKNIIIDNEGYNFPAFVSVYEESLGSYEYALADIENSKIIYIYAQICGLDKTIVDSRYLPIDFIVPDQLVDKEWDGYNLYYYTLNNGDRDLVE